MRRSATERGFKAGMLRDQVGHTRPGRQRVERLDEAGTEHRLSAVTLPARPAERVKLSDQGRYFGRIEDCGDLGRDRAPCYVRTCQASAYLSWSRPRKLQLRGGYLL